MTAIITAEVEITINDAQTLPAGAGIREFEKQLEELITLPGLVESTAKITRMILS